MAIQHCDGRRKRRNSPVRGRRMWYSYSRGVRFKRRLSIVEVNIGPPSLEGFRVYISQQMMIIYQYDGCDCRHG
jgi:hypothetical protein